MRLSALDRDRNPPSFRKAIVLGERVDFLNLRKGFLFSLRNRDGSLVVDLHERTVWLAISDPYIDYEQDDLVIDVEDISSQILAA